MFCAILVDIAPIARSAKANDGAVDLGSLTV
jgi:hypothetical protein